MRGLSSICLIFALSSALSILSQFSHTGAASGQPGSQAAAIEDESPAQGPDSDGVETVIIKGEVLESVLGREVRTKVEEEMGRIVDVLVDRSCRVQAAVIEFGGFLGIGTRKIAVEWSALRVDTQSKPSTIVLDMTRDQLHKVPEYKPREPAVTRKAIN